MNEYTGHHSVRYQTLQDACRLAKPGYYCAKLDLQSAYRSVPIHPDDYKATGLAWRFEGEDTDTYLFDARLHSVRLVGHRISVGSPMLLDV